MKELKDMSLEELWHLFPIVLVDYNQEWINYYQEMKELLLKLLINNHLHQIHHIGSTSIKNIKSKNIIDILIEIDNYDNNINNIITILTSNNFILMNQTTTRASLNYGYTKYGYEEKVYHIHLRHVNDNKEIYFRDYLNEFEDVKLADNGKLKM